MDKTKPVDIDKTDPIDDLQERMKFSRRVATGMVVLGTASIGAGLAFDKDSLISGGLMANMGGVVLAIHIGRLLDSKEFRRLKEQQAKTAPTFFALDEEIQRSGIQLIAQEARSLPAGEHGKEIPAEELDLTIAKLLENFAKDPVAIGVAQAKYGNSAGAARS